MADKSKQCTYDGYDKSDRSSPTVVTKSIFMTGVIDAKEKREVAVLDIKNTFLQADNDEIINMCLRGKLAEMMVRIDPTLYRKYVTYSANGVSTHAVREAVQSSLRSVEGCFVR